MTSPLSPADLAQSIKQRAAELGFDACGIAKAEPVATDAVERYDRWIASGANDCMQWAERHRELRNDPRLLLDGAQSVIVLACNYYPQTLRPSDQPQFAYYAYGNDYHDVLRDKARCLADHIRHLAGDNVACRVCVDSAPIRERYWARIAGIGFVGLNNMLIIPGKGSFFFLCEVLTTLALTPDAPCTASCGECHACEAACPTQALGEGLVDARRCLSCQTIENHDEQLPTHVVKAMGNRVYGCDVCQLVCPHNSRVVPTDEPQFQPSAAFLNLTREQILNLTREQFNTIFRHSAVKRAKLQGLVRNAKASKS